MRPNEPAIVHAMEHAYAPFAAAELHERKTFGYPPYRRLLRVVLRGLEPMAVLDRGRELARRLDAAQIEGVEWLGPATPQIARLEGRHRRHLLVKAPTPSGIRRALDALKAAPGPLPRGRGAVRRRPRRAPLTAVGPGAGADGEGRGEGYPIRRLSVFAAVGRP